MIVPLEVLKAKRFVLDLILFNLILFPVVDSINPTPIPLLVTVVAKSDALNFASLLLVISAIYTYQAPALICSITAFCKFFIFVFAIVLFFKSQNSVCHLLRLPLL